MVRRVSKTQEETEMARRGENIHKRKDGRWEGRYIKARTPEGKIQWGYVYGTVYAEVKRVLIQKKAEAGFYNLKRTDLAFEALAEVWLHSQRNAVKESTYAHYSYTLHKYLLPVLSKVPVASLEESFLEQAMQQIIAPIDAAHKPLGNSSARECLSMLRRICKYAAHLRLIRPMELEVALPKAIDKISVPLSPAEQQRLYQYVQEDPTPRKIGLLLGVELGLRIGEICGLQWGDFDLKLGTLKINRTVCRISCGNGHTKVVIQTPKTRTSRREIPIPKQLLIMLKKLRGCVSNATWFLSGNESKPTEPRCYRKSIKAYLKQSTVRQVRPHALRHTFATTVTAHENLDYQAVQNNSCMTLPDGKPLSSVGIRRGYSEMGRVTGPDFMEQVIAATEKSDARHYFYGTTQENLNALLEYLKVNYPQLSIVGCEPSLFRPLTIQEETELCDRINESKADFVWVALGAPRQEKFCAKLSKNTNAVWIAVGGAFNVISGVIPRAPQWMQDHSLEWLYRWSKEPKRLFKRYAETNSKFIFYLIKEKVEKR